MKTNIYTEYPSREDESSESKKLESEGIKHKPVESYYKIRNIIKNKESQSHFIKLTDTKITREIKKSEIKEPTIKTSVKKYVDIGWSGKRQSSEFTNIKLGPTKSYTCGNWALKHLHPELRNKRTTELSYKKPPLYSKNNHDVVKDGTGGKKEKKYEGMNLKIDIGDILNSDPYNVLEVNPGESIENIKRSYKEKLLKAHPDKGGSIEEFVRLKTAYEILSDEQ